MWKSADFSSRYVAELEKSIVSVERIREYQSTPQEAAFELPDIDPDPSWPLAGKMKILLEPTDLKPISVF